MIETTQAIYSNSQYSVIVLQATEAFRCKLLYAFEWHTLPSFIYLAKYLEPCSPSTGYIQYKDMFMC